MKLGLFLVLFQDRELEAALDRCVELGLQTVEIGTGGYPGTAHCDPAALLANDAAVDAFADAVASRGLEISALSCHGNPLHPDERAAADYDAVYRRTLELASRLGLDTVCLFSGCPGTPAGGGVPNWVTTAWPPEYAELLEWQWRERVVPYWVDAAAEAGRAGVRLAFEMHPGFSVYNPRTLLRLREAVGEVVGANFDPSHLVWQGIDPLVAIRELGRAGAIFHVHAKDVRVDLVNTARDGVLDPRHYSEVRDRAWSFRTVGFGHGRLFWRELVSELRVAGYDGAISIEHEDPLLSVDEGLGRAIELLRDSLLYDGIPEMWWA